MGWTLLVLIPKQTTCTQGIGLLYTLWKLLEALIDTRLKVSLQLHMFFTGYGIEEGRGRL